MQGESKAALEHLQAEQHVEILKCDRCRKRWEVGWVDGGSVEQPLTCDCGRVLKVVQVAERSDS